MFALPPIDRSDRYDFQDDDEDVEEMPARRGRPVKKRVTQEEADALSPRKMRKRRPSSKQAEEDDEADEEPQGSPVKKARRQEAESSKVKTKPTFGPKSKIDPKIDKARTEAVVGSSRRTSSRHTSSPSPAPVKTERFMRGEYAQEIYDLTTLLLAKRYEEYDEVSWSECDLTCKSLTRSRKLGTTCTP